MSIAQHFSVLDDAAVRAALPMAEAIEVNRSAFLSAENGSAVIPERHILSTASGPTLFKPGASECLQ